jgi:hypothetical protein
LIGGKAVEKTIRLAPMPSRHGAAVIRLVVDPELIKQECKHFGLLADALIEWRPEPMALAGTGLQ